MKHLKTSILLGLLLATPTAHTLAADTKPVAADAKTSDYAKEKRWADQIVDGLLVGDAVWLQAGDHKFLGIYAEQTADKPLGGAIVLHGSGVHPDWGDVIQPLRSELPDHGWSTLSLQLPVLANEAKYKEYAPLFADVPARIDAGIAYLREQGVQNVVIVAHSLGSAMAASYLAGKNGGAGSITAFVAVGMSARKNMIKEMDTLAFLKKINIPTLDLYGSQDLEAVLASVKLREQAARMAPNPKYEQRRVEGANHFFHGLEGDLVRVVRSWLSKHAGVEIQGAAATPAAEIQ